MIAQLRGNLLEKHPNQAIVECAGVGYDVVIPVSTFSSLPAPGAEVRLRIHTHVREDAIQLFGFLSIEEKSLFEKLISVSGIGPKLAITVLSGVQAPASIEIDSQLATFRNWSAFPESARRPPSASVSNCATRWTRWTPRPRQRPPFPSPPPRSRRTCCRRWPTSVASVLPPRSLFARPSPAGTPAEFEPLFRKSLELVR